MTFFFLFRPSTAQWLVAEPAGMPRKKKERKALRKYLTVEERRARRHRKEDEELIMIMNLLGLIDD